MVTRPSHTRHVWFALIAGAALSTAVLQAQGGLHATPSVSISQQYDSNVFSTPIAPQSDFITRAAMGLGLERESVLWTASVRYAQDMERFTEHRDLSSVAARQRGTLALRYRRSPRTAWSGDAEIWRTETPSELNEVTGLTVSRASAQRLLGHASLNRHLSPVTAGTIDYTVTQDHLAGRTSATTQDAVAAVERRRSPRDTLTLRYRFREFLFTSATAAPTFTSNSHAITAGFSRAITRRLQLTVEAGPRVTNTTAAADVAASIHYQRMPDLSVSYARTQATVIGFPGVADVQSVSASVEWPLWSAVRLRLSPGLFRSEMGPARADAYAVALDITRPIVHDLSLDFSVTSNLQRGGFSPGTPNMSIARHVALIRLIAGPSSLLW